MCSTTRVVWEFIQLVGTNNVIWLAWLCVCRGLFLVLGWGGGCTSGIKIVLSGSGGGNTDLCCLLVVREGV